MPFLIERFQEAANPPEMAKRLPNGLLYEIQRFYYDTAQVSNPVTMAGLLKIVPLSQVLFGNDFPYRRSDEPLTGLRKCGFSTEDQKAIERENALRLVPRLKKA